MAKVGYNSPEGQIPLWCGRGGTSLLHAGMVFSCFSTHWSTMATRAVFLCVCSSSKYFLPKRKEYLFPKLSLDLLTEGLFRVPLSQIWQTAGALTLSSVLATNQWFGFGLFVCLLGFVQMFLSLSFPVLFSHWMSCFFDIHYSIHYFCWFQ